MANYYKVMDNGVAPPGLKVGDLVVTGAGVYEITATGVADSASGYSSKLVDKDTTTENFKGGYSRPVVPKPGPAKAGAPAPGAPKAGAPRPGAPKPAKMPIKGKKED